MHLVASIGRITTVDPALRTTRNNGLKTLGAGCSGAIQAIADVQGSGGAGVPKCLDMVVSNEHAVNI